MGPSVPGPESWPCPFMSQISGLTSLSFESLCAERDNDVTSQARTASDSKCSHGAPAVTLYSLGRRPLLSPALLRETHTKEEEEPLRCLPQPVCARPRSKQVPASNPQDEPWGWLLLLVPCNSREQRGTGRESASKDTQLGQSGLKEGTLVWAG